VERIKFKPEGEKFEASWNPRGFSGATLELLAGQKACKILACGFAWLGKGQELGLVRESATDFQLTSTVLNSAGDVASIPGSSGALYKAYASAGDFYKKRTWSNFRKFTAEIASCGSTFASCCLTVNKMGLAILSESSTYTCKVAKPGLSLLSGAFKFTHEQNGYYKAQKQSEGMSEKLHVASKREATARVFANIIGIAFQAFLFITALFEMVVNPIIPACVGTVYLTTVISQHYFSSAKKDAQASDVISAMKDGHITYQEVGG